MNGLFDRSLARSTATTPTILDLTYEHDPTGRISRLFSRDGTSTSNGVITETYTYDQVGRLLVANGVRDGAGPGLQRLQREASHRERAREESVGCGCHRVHLFRQVAI